MHVCIRYVRVGEFGCVASDLAILVMSPFLKMEGEISIKKHLTWYEPLSALPMLGQVHRQDRLPTPFMNPVYILAAGVWLDHKKQLRRPS